LQKSRAENEQAPLRQELPIVVGNSLPSKNVAFDLEIQTKDLEMNKQNKDWLMSLERERLDQSWKQVRPAAITEFTKVIYKQKPTNHRFRDNVMFQEGRYSMGARDEAALTGHRLAENLIGKKAKE
jgi:hypothetical protein